MQTRILPKIHFFFHKIGLDVEYGIMHAMKGPSILLSPTLCLIFFLSWGKKLHSMHVPWGFALSLSPHNMAASYIGRIRTRKPVPESTDEAEGRHVSFWANAPLHCQMDSFGGGTETQNKSLDPKPLSQKFRRLGFGSAEPMITETVWIEITGLPPVHVSRAEMWRHALLPCGELSLNSPLRVDGCITGIDIMTSRDALWMIRVPLWYLYMPASSMTGQGHFLSNYVNISFSCPTPYKQCESALVHPLAHPWDWRGLH